MDLQELQRNWNEFGKQDPLWAILTFQGKRDGQWNIEEFFAAGRAEIAKVIEQAGTLGVPTYRRSALDFGCGVGRLTQALCGWFEHACGVDIAPSMIEQARAHNRHGARCQYFVNPHDDLRIFPDNSFDLIYSNLVLQHMEPRYSKAYIREFVRLLSPGGLAIFQIPDGRILCSRDARPIADDGFRAAFGGYPPEIRMAASSRMDVPVTVRNVSPCTWPGRGDEAWNYAVQLGNHWLAADGTMALWDDGRQPLPGDLEPGGEAQVFLTVTAPAIEGDYLLDLDMVQEGVSWFRDKDASSGSAKIPVHVHTDPGNGGAEEDPRMELHGVPKKEVLEILSAGGAQVLDCQPDNSAGDKWVAFMYFAAKLG